MRPGVKKSNFSAQTSLDSSDTVDFVRNGQNFKMTITNFLASLGVTGTLIQKGGLTSIPILNKSGTVNEIRNIEPGAGILPTLDSEDAILLSHNFAQGDAGSPILYNPTDDQPVIRNLVPGTGVTIAPSGNNLVIDLSGATPASNVVVVNSMADFPTAVSGVITLGNDSAYLVSAFLTTANRFVLGDNTIVYGAGSRVAGLQYTGTGTMFTGTDVSAKITLLTLDAPNGTLFDIAISAGSSVFELTNLTVTSCDTIGTLAGVTASQITDTLWGSIISAGLTFSGSMGIFVGSRNVFTSDVDVFDFGSSTFSLGFILETSTFSFGAPAAVLNGAVDSANIAVGALGSIVNCRVFNTTAPLIGITTSDIRWIFFANSVIENSASGLLATNTNSLITIAVVNTPVLINTNWSVVGASRFTESNGRFTYTGLGERMSIAVAISATGGSVSEDVFNFYVYLNGAQVSASKITRTFSSTSAGSISMFWAFELNTSDYIELFVENASDDSNITINNAIIEVRI